MPDYGLKVFNGDNKLILDSTEGFSTFIKTAGGTLGPITSNAINYPSGVNTGDLFFVRLPGNGFIAEKFYSGNGNRQLYTTHTGSQQWLKADRTTSNVANHTNGYGLNVFDGTGTAVEDLLFSTNATTALDIAAVGTWNFNQDSSVSGVTEVVYTPPAQWSQTDHYVLINGSVYSEGSTTIMGSSFPVIVKIGYEFNYNNNALTNIKLQAIIETGGNGGIPIPSASSALTSSMIVRLRS
jgi:hypothetical protein